MRHIREEINVGDSPDLISPDKRGKIEGGELGYEPIMPQADTTHIAAGEAYQKAFTKLARYIPPEQMPDNSNKAIGLIMGMMHTLSEIKEKEGMYTEYLEMLAVETVLNLPEFESAKKAYESGDIQIDAELITGVIQVDEEGLEQDLEEQEENFGGFTKEIEYALTNMNQEKMKRRFTNIMTQGAAASYMYLFEYIREEISNIDPELPDMYGFMSSVGDLAYWVTPDINMSGMTKAGDEEVTQDEETGAGVIKVRAVILPLLMHELVKGLMEYTSSHALPGNTRAQQEVINDVDTPENEVYDLMLGPVFWQRLRDSIDPRHANLLLHVWNKILSLPANDASISGSFAQFMKAFLRDPDTAKMIVGSFIKDIQLALDRYEGQERSELPTFESYNVMIQEALTNMMRSLLLKYPEITEEELEQWSLVDPTGIKGINLASMLKLKQNGKIKSPKDITNIINQTTYVPVTVKYDKRKVPTDIVLQGAARKPWIEKNANLSLPWVLKQINQNNIIYPEDLPDVEYAIQKFYRYKDTGKWPADKPKNLYNYKTFEQLHNATSDVMESLFSNEIKGQTEILPDTKLLEVNGDYELIRIFPTVQGQESLHEYAYPGNIKKASWCTANFKAWNMFVTYLKLDQVPGYSDIARTKKRLPESIIQDPLYSHYYIAKEGKPWALFEFRSNHYMNKGDVEFRQDPAYKRDILPMIERNIPPARSLVRINTKNKTPSDKLVLYINKNPEGVADLIYCLLEYYRVKYKKNPFVDGRTEAATLPKMTRIIMSLNKELKDAFSQFDRNWFAGMNRWAQYSGDNTRNITTGTNDNINLNNDKLKKRLLSNIVNENNSPCSAIGTEEYGRFKDMIHARVMAEPVSEGVIGRTLGAAALATALNTAPVQATPNYNVKKNSSSLVQYDRAEQHNIIARTIWAEGKGEGTLGMEMVASVIHNRGRGNPEKMVREIKIPLAFSCWNSMTPDEWEKFTIRKRSTPEWEVASKLANEIMRGTFKPLTTATHYFNPVKSQPSWGYNNGKLKPHKKVGRHVFMSVKR